MNAFKQFSRNVSRNVSKNIFRRRLNFLLSGRENPAFKPFSKTIPRKFASKYLSNNSCSRQQMTSSFLIADVPVPVSIVFDESVLPFLVEEDRKLLQNFLSFSQAFPSLSEFSLEFRRCLFSICGADSASFLQIDPTSCTRKCLELDHLEERPVKFYLRHISGLPEWTKGKPNKGSTGDHVVVERVLEPPYLQGDYKAASPKGALDFAISATLRDMVLYPRSIVGISYTWQMPQRIGSVWIIRLGSAWEMTNAPMHNQARNSSQPRPSHFMR